jgi:threonine dehydratase
VNLISRIIERGLVKDGRLVRLVVKLPDRPGMLAGFVSVLAENGANVVEIYHNRAFSKSVKLGEALVEVTLETRGRSHVEELLATLRSKNWEAQEET